MTIQTIRNRLIAIRNAADSLDTILGEVGTISGMTPKDLDRLQAALDGIAGRLEAVADKLGGFVDPSALKPTEEMHLDIWEDGLLDARVDDPEYDGFQVQ